MLVLGVDVETTGLDVLTAQITEIGAILWDTKCNAPVRMLSSFLYETDRYPPLTEEITKLTGIQQSNLVSHALRPKTGLTMLAKHMQIADYVMAHNGELFDKPLIMNRCKEYGIELPEKTWIDTSCDVPYPESTQTRKLTYLATEHGFLNPFPHRAIFDVMTMLKIASQYDWEIIFKWAQAPVLAVAAGVSFHTKDEARKRGYRYNPNQKIWWKTIKDFQLEEEKRKCPFQVTIIERPKE